MVSPKLFESCPPFPADVPTARVDKISLAKLKTGDASEASRLFEACRTVGFFLLDLKNEPAGEEFIETITTTFGIAKEIFDLSVEEKEKYNMEAPRKLLGYKAMGVAKIETGEPDKCEFFNVGQDDLLVNEPIRENPLVVFDNRQTLVEYLDQVDPIVQLVLSILDTHLGLPKGTLSSHQRRDKLSNTTIRMIRYPPQVVKDRRTSLVQHTDFGTLTILSNVIGGLEILQPDSDSPNEQKKATWRYVKPEPNCVIVNVGDALVEWTGGILRSCLHRVTFAPGQQASFTRYSVAYLIRPEQNASMKRLTGGYIPSADENGEKDVDLTASEWEGKRMIALRDGTEIMESRGGREFVRA